MVRKTGTELALVGILILGGCRAVIGIDDLQRGDASVDASFVDGGSPDVAAEASPDGAPAADGGDAGRTLAECNAYCRSDGGAADGGAAFSNEMHSCICQGASFKACGAECGGYCPNGSANSPACETCLLQQAFGSGVCVAKASNCTSACQGFLQCVTKCQ